MNLLFVLIICCGGLFGLVYHRYAHSKIGPRCYYSVLRTDRAFIQSSMRSASDWQLSAEQSSKKPSGITHAFRVRTAPPCVLLPGVPYLSIHLYEVLVGYYYDRSFFI
jgi:hypothetical protein